VPKISEERKEAVRRRLVDAAVDLLRDKGVEATTTRGILERAGLSNGALYHYFASVNDLYLAVAEEIYRENLAGLATAVSGPDGEVDLVALVRRMFDAPGERSLLPEMRARAVHDDAIRHALARFDRLIVEASTDMVSRRGGLDSDDPAAVVELVLAVFEALTARARAGGFVTDFDRVAGVFVDLLVRAYGWESA
jgi:AcrR family transcriptional regulator